MKRVLFLLVSGVVVTTSFSACPWYKPNIAATNKCVVNTECPEGHACREGRCEDIYYPKSKIRQY